VYTGHGTLKHWREPKYIVVLDWLRLCLDQATGDVYFTDGSTTYLHRFNTKIMMNADATGRLLWYDARTKVVAVLRAGLPYPNGVAVSADRTHVVVAVPAQVFRSLHYIAGASSLADTSWV